MKIRGQKKLKLLDRYIGIPLVFFLGLLKRKKELPKRINNIGVLLTPAIGDTILISAPLKDMKGKLKPDKIIFFVPEGNDEAAKLINIADEIIPINLLKIFKTIKLIRGFSFDLFIDAAQWSRTNAILTFFVNSNYKIGFDTNKQYRNYVYDSCAIHSGKVHEIYNFRNLISCTGIESESLPEIKINTDIDDKKISIHLSAGGYLSYLKEWPQKNWIEIVRYLKARNFKIYFTGADKDYNTIDELLANLTNKESLFNVAGKFNLEQTAYHLKSCKLVLSVDTGIMHLASAVGVNLIAIHGPTDSGRWGSLNGNSISINSNYFSAPCLNLGFEYNCIDRSGECMKAIPVSEVIKAIDHFIN